MLEYKEINIEDFLKKYSGQKVVYCANPGNAGDAIIAHSTFQLFKMLNIFHVNIKHEDVVSDEIIFYAGGGNLVEGKYKHSFHFINNNYRQNREIILLPHTVHGYDELLLSANNMTIFCREKTSYQYLSSIGFPSEKLFLAHDMAVLLSPSEFQDCLQDGEGVANCFRNDQESGLAIKIPDDNVDISLSWNGEYWHRADFAKNVTHNLACYLSAFETVKTDRLHVAILAGILGKNVLLYPNNYYKIKAVYEYSLKNRFNQLTFIENDKQHEIPKVNNPIDELQKKIETLEKLLHEKDRNIAAMNHVAGQLNEVIQSKSWRITKPLRDIMAKFKRKGIFR